MMSYVPEDIKSGINKYIYNIHISGFHSEYFTGGGRHCVTYTTFMQMTILACVYHIDQLFNHRGWKGETWAGE